MRRWPVGLFSCVVVLAILWLTLAPHPLPDADVPLFPGVDKVVHALMFGGLAFAWMFDIVLSRLKRGGHSRGRCLAGFRRTMLAAIACCVGLFGGVIEVLQWLMGLGRGMELGDFIADCLGAVVAVIISPYIIRCIFPRN